MPVQRSTRAQLGRERLELRKRPVFHGQERLVDTVDLQAGRVEPEDLHDPPAHVAVERVVGAEHLHAPLPEPFPPLELGGTHGDAERLGFPGASNHAAVVVGEHDHGQALQTRLEDALTRAVEGVSEKYKVGRENMKLDSVFCVNTPGRCRVSGRAGG